MKLSQQFVVQCLHVNDWEKLWLKSCCSGVQWKSRQRWSSSRLAALCVCGSPVSAPWRNAVPCLLWENLNKTGPEPSGSTGLCLHPCWTSQMTQWLNEKALQAGSNIPRCHDHIFNYACCTWIFLIQIFLCSDHITHLHFSTRPLIVSLGAERPSRRWINECIWLLVEIILLVGVSLQRIPRPYSDFLSFDCANSTSPLSECGFYFLLRPSQSSFDYAC